MMQFDGGRVLIRCSSASHVSCRGFLRLFRPLSGGLTDLSQGAHAHKVVDRHRHHKEPVEFLDTAYHDLGCLAFGKPSACVTIVLTTRPCRLSLSVWPFVAQLAGRLALAVHPGIRIGLRFVRLVIARVTFGIAVAVAIAGLVVAVLANETLVSGPGPNERFVQASRRFWI